MPTCLDHLILRVNDRDASVDFYRDIQVVYFFDPSRHLLEIRSYPPAAGKIADLRFYGDVTL
ncbi:MAG: hypothetical protein ACI9WU_004223 [Myxococcota bacterium]|jgi:hypothetical protein